MTNRKIIQITGTGVDNNAGTQCDSFLWALCDDGTVWRIADAYGWVAVPPIPQDENEEPVWASAAGTAP